MTLPGGARAELIAAMVEKGYTPAPDDWTSAQFDAAAGHLYVDDWMNMYRSASELPLGRMGWWFIPARAAGDVVEKEEALR